MGFLDKLAKAVEVIDKVVGEGGSFNPDHTSDHAAKSAPKTPAAVLATGGEPIASYRTVKGTHYDGNDAEIELKLSYEIPTDFGEFESHAEPDMCCMYKHTDEDELDLNKPIICLTPAFYGYVDSFVKSGTVNGAKSFERVSVGKMLFKASADYHGQTAVFYGFEQGEATLGHMAIAMIFCNDVIGTPLEKKLMQVLDHAAATYSETRN